MIFLGGDYKKAEEIESMLDQTNSSYFIKLKLGKLSDSEFEELQNGTYKSSILPYQALNQRLLVKMKSNADLREGALKEQENRSKRGNKLLREMKLKKQFSKWDGSHRKLEEYIKENMHAPSSYDHIETRYSDNGKRIVVTTDFRGKNAFGATVKNSISAEVSLDGDIVHILN